MREYPATRVPPAQPRPPVDRASVADQAMAEQAAHAGRMLEMSFVNGDRDMALIWQQAMYAIVELRKARRFCLDTHTVKGAAE